jgi:hypothetical protein
MVNVEVKRWGLTVVVALVLSATLVTPASAQQQDTVILRSGNPVIGEVQSLKRGSLSFDTEEMDVVEIDWDDIAFVRSASYFEVTLSSGALYFGSLAGADTARLVVVGVDRSDTLAFQDVVAIGSIEQGFFARTNGFIDVGTNLARANRLASVLVKGRFTYRGPWWGFDVSGESYWQRQESVSEANDTTTQTTKRNAFGLSVNRSLGARWVIVGSGQLEQNQELELDRRLLGSFGGGYQIIRNHGVEWYVGAGGTVNDERYTDEEPNTTAELQVITGFDAFDVGDVDLYTKVTTYSSPADGGRFRMDVDARIAWEIFSDFTIGLNVTERFDSKPPSATAAKRDYQYALSIGWSWS